MVKEERRREEKSGELKVSLLPCRTKAAYAGCRVLTSFVEVGNIAYTLEAESLVQSTVRQELQVISSGDSITAH